MSRYSINFDKLVNQLCPHFLSGRKLSLFQQALLKPLQIINDQFANYAVEMRIDTVMTSQKLKFEWYLNRRLSKYFLNGGNISVITTKKHGHPIYYEDRNQYGSKNIILHNAEEKIDNLPLKFENEKSRDDELSEYSFVVMTPEINTRLISQNDYIQILSNYIERYRLANKTYIIKFNN